MNESSKIFVFKIGGKFLKEVQNPFFSYFMNPQYTKDISLFLIPGGGQAVNKLRIQYKKSNNESKDIEFHWKAIKKMDENAEKLYENLCILCKHHKYMKKLKLISSLSDVSKEKNTIYIFQPYSDLLENDDLEQSWAVTSDSIALYYAKKLGLNHTFLIKDVNYLKYQNREIEKVNCNTLFEWMKEVGYIEKLNENLGKGTQFPIDQFAPSLCNQYKMNLYLINGNDSGKLIRLLSYLKGEIQEFSEIGTQIYPN